MKFNSLIKKSLLLLIILLVVFSITNLYAQEKEKSGLKKKLSDIKGKVEKITVRVDGKDVVFDGEEAENLVKKMKKDPSEGITYSFGARGLRGRNFTVLRGDLDEIAESGDEDILISIAGDGTKEAKSIKVEKSDGKTKVTIKTTDENGEEVIKTLEGKEAEKYLEENEEGVISVSDAACATNLCGKMKMKVMKGKPARTIIIEKNSDDDDDNTVIIQKPVKAKKEIIIKKKKADTKKEE